MRIFAVSNKNKDVMKYNELHRLLASYGCHDTRKERRGHPLWYSPLTGQTFETSHHRSAEVATGTLRKILKEAGIKK